MEKKKTLWLSKCLMLFIAATCLVSGLQAQEVPDIPLEYIYYSTEEDFTAEIDVPGGNVISDGDLLVAPGSVYMRNFELMMPYGTDFDLGLDAADVLVPVEQLVVFSTELDHPDDFFSSGDLLSTFGMIIPNSALLYRFNLPQDLNLGLDAVQLIGKKESVIEFFHLCSGIPKEEWIMHPQMLQDIFEMLQVDIWFSTEGTGIPLDNPNFLDGDLLSAATGTIILSNFNALPLSVPAGLPARGVDFGMDAAASLAYETPTNISYIYFSTEILYEENMVFTDGDVMLTNLGPIYDNYQLISNFYPAADFMGLDALSFERNADIIVIEEGEDTSDDDVVVIDLTE